MFNRIKKLSHYQLGVGLSALSMAFGIGREFLLIALLGVSSANDQLQLYLSVFYAIGMSIDVMRLSTLNLYQSLSLSRIFFTASLIGLPFCLLIGALMRYTTDGFQFELLAITLIGGYLNLMAALLITYKQRADSYLIAQIINVMPNFILIPGILLSYIYLPLSNLIYAVVCLTSAIPVFQCIFLLMVPSHKVTITSNKMTYRAGVLIFLRHFSAILGEQFFQIMLRSAFYRAGTGFLSVFAISIRLYSALRFILVDSFIGAKLARWQRGPEPRKVVQFFQNKWVLIPTVTFTSMLCLMPHQQLLVASCNMVFILVAGFYLSTLVRIIYFKINREGNYTNVIMRFAGYELLFALLGCFLAIQFDYPILVLLWLGYIMKPFAQLHFLKKQYHGIVSSCATSHEP